MPQKKNPDLLEFLRGKSGSTYGNLFSMLTILKGLPLSYFKDLQDDKEIVFKSYDTLIGCLKIFEEVIKNLRPNREQMFKLANNGYITATDLADYLVKNHSMSFRKAYQKTAGIVNLAEKKKKNLNELSLDEMKKIVPGLKDDVFKVFDLKNSVNSKRSYGGTSFDNIKKMIMKYKKLND
jgi:argininosuccinate lyase